MTHHTATANAHVEDAVETVDAVLLDLDGTLVDSVYAHTLAWKSAFRDVGMDVPAHRIHRAIGISGDRLVAHVAGDRVEAAVGDAVRDAHRRHLDERLHDVVPTDGARDLLEALRERDVTVVLASAGGAEITGRLLDLLEAAKLLDEVVTGSDVDSGKPSGELVAAAMAAVAADRAVLVGDTVWDVQAATDAGIPCVGLLTGGIAESELREAGAIAVFDTPRDLAEHLDEVLPSDKHPLG
ncbi:phosphoglycolate phosphatase [Nocardioides ginsengisegetis]|uniref:Phosphoglycolate phosphatase n=1 Tax=Nocardioides ginsengisegetis TaxID=661491 RepID=A0A7W3J352_9ACTN|nr:HAD family hydrolase [Nocardioides ginsengisegetis]MBA8805418.1 phosphoglycolate phosphatase [Nocardioides ginsengisegetis]